MTFNTDLDDAAWDLSFTNDADEYIASHETSDGAVLTITPDDYLEYNTEYTIIIYPPSEDSKATHRLKDEYTFSFTTEDDTVSVKKYYTCRWGNQGSYQHYHRDCLYAKYTIRSRGSYEH